MFWVWLKLNENFHWWKIYIFLYFFCFDGYFMQFSFYSVHWVDVLKIPSNHYADESCILCFHMWPVNFFFFFLTCFGLFGLFLMKVCFWIFPMLSRDLDNLASILPCNQNDPFGFFSFFTFSFMEMVSM